MASLYCVKGAGRRLGEDSGHCNLQAVRCAGRAKLAGTRVCFGALVAPGGVPSVLAFFLGLTDPPCKPKDPET